MYTDELRREHDARSSATSAETMRVRGEALAAKVKELLHEGNVRRVVVRNVDGHTILEIPVTAGLVAAVIAPALVAVAAMAALASSWEVEIERVSEPIAAASSADSTHVSSR